MGRVPVRGRIELIPALLAVADGGHLRALTRETMTDPAVPITLPSEPIDLRLVVTDLDGTLLDADGRIPDQLWGLLPRLRERGITLAPASGRQYTSLRRLFAPSPEGIAYIAENGTFVVLEGGELTSSPLDPAFASALVGIVRALSASGHDLGLVWCGRRTAYVERRDAAFVERVGTYYPALEVVDDLDAVAEQAIKFAVYDYADHGSEVTALLRQRCAPYRVVPSSAHWVDIMSPGANKGAALESLQHRLGVTPAQTVVFGDYLNDLEMISGTPHSFAMANGHPDVIEAARYVAPTNSEHGVIRVLEQLLEGSAPAA